MEQSAPPPSSTSPTSAAAPRAPEVIQRIEENRLRAKALRDQREAAERASGRESAVLKSASGFVATSDVHISKPTNKRSFSAMTAASPSSAPSAPLAPSASSSTISAAAAAAAETSSGSNRDARNAAGGEAIRPARNFTKYVDYNMSSMTDTKGGFLSTEDDPHNYALGGGNKAGQQADGDAAQRPKGMTLQEWERQRTMRNLKRLKAGPYEPGLSVLDDKQKRKKCRECGSLEIDWVWEEVFHICVCNKCKEQMPDKYSLLTKTECKEDYLLTDPELRDPELLPHLNKPNPHKSHWHDMMLFLRFQVEDYAIKTKWGSAEALDAEYERREVQKKARKEAKFREKLLDLKRKTRTDAFRRQAGSLAKTGASKFGDTMGGGGKHVHDWGRTVENEEGLSVKTCLECGMEVEELEF